jgi:uncharacterized membrane protein
MPTDVTTAPTGKDSFPVSSAKEPSLSSLVSGIFDDSQKLIEHQFSLLKHDLKKDIDRAKDTWMLLGFAVGLLSAAGLLLLFMLVHLLEWLTRPNLEWWACYAIVGGALALVGGVVYYRAKQQLETLNVIPEQAAQGLKENLQWKTNPN